MFGTSDTDNLINQILAFSKMWGHDIDPLTKGSATECLKFLWLMIKISQHFEASKFGCVSFDDWRDQSGVWHPPITPIIITKAFNQKERSLLTWMTSKKKKWCPEANFTEAFERKLKVLFYSDFKFLPAYTPLTLQVSLKSIILSF